MPKTKKSKKAKYKEGDEVWFRKSNGEWDKGEVGWVQSNFKGHRYFVDKCKYAQQVFDEDYLFTEKEMKKLTGVTDE